MNCKLLFAYVLLYGFVGILALLSLLSFVCHQTVTNSEYRVLPLRTSLKPTSFLLHVVLSPFECLVVSPINSFPNPARGHPAYSIYSLSRSFPRCVPIAQCVCANHPNDGQ